MKIDLHLYKLVVCFIKLSPNFWQVFLKSFHQNCPRDRRPEWEWECELGVRNSFSFHDWKNKKTPILPYLIHTRIIPLIFTSSCLIDKILQQPISTRVDRSFIHDFIPKNYTNTTSIYYHPFIFYNLYEWTILLLISRVLIRVRVGHHHSPR